MEKTNENYYLVKINTTKRSKEYFNFITNKFTPTKGKGVALATIDSMTTFFEDGQELELYFNRDRKIISNDDYCYKIEFKGKNKNILKTLNIVWNDMNLNALSKLTEGEVDFTGTQQYTVIKDIFDKLNQGSLLGSKITRTKKEDYKLSEDAKKAIIVAYSNSKEAESIFFDTFKSYNDARALYLADQEYQKNKTTKISIRDLYAKIKTR